MQLESYLANVSVVQRCIHLVQDEEGSWAEAERHDTSVPNRRHSEPAMWVKCLMQQVLDNVGKVLQKERSIRRGDEVFNLQRNKRFSTKYNKKEAAMMDSGRCQVSL